VAFLDRFVPPPLRATAELHRRARTVAGGSLAVGIAAGLVGVARALVQAWEPQTGWTLATAAVALLGLPLLRVTRRPEVPAFALLAVGTAALLAIARAEGGLQSQAIYWAPLVPLWTVFFVGRLAGAALTGMLALGFVALHLASDPVAPAADDPFLRLASALGASFAALGVAVLYETSRLRAQEQILAERARIDRLKDELVATVSHELRTPLTSIRGALGLLEGGGTVPLPEPARPLVAIARRNSDRLGLLIDDLLDLERIESGGLAYDRCVVEVAPLIDEAVESDRALAGELGVEIAVRSDVGDARITVDPRRLQQVISNLISNAAKHSPRGATVDIAAHVVEGHVELSVTDRGPGIPADFRGRVFERFARADSSDARRTGGTGLGLSIAKRIVEDSGGRIWFTTRTGGGTTFHVRLPLASVLPSVPDA
jgi:signal transduction histidine kinase